MNVLSMVVSGLVLVAAWALWRRRQTVACAVDLEATQEHFHAHVELEGAFPNEGDEVLVAGMPTRIPLGEQRTFRSEATIARASLPRRWIQRLVGRTHITDLYDVGFEG
jgi:hypothetical protein